MSKYNSLCNIFRLFTEFSEDGEPPYYDVGERTIYVLDVVPDHEVQIEISDIEDLLTLGGFEGEYRIEMEVMCRRTAKIKLKVIDLILIKIPRSSSATTYEAKQR